MRTDKWNKVKEILGEVLSLEPAERDEFLDAAALGAEIRAEVESLLAFETEAENSMHLSAMDFSRDFFNGGKEKNAFIGQNFGVYRVVRELGYGGMGAVYLAERTDGKFEQKVALKVLKREMNTAALRRRFEQEREILAALEHTNIARLLDAGTTGDGIPYLAMEYIEGLPIDEFCNKNKLALDKRLDLFRKVCAAVNFAHRNLVVHRDLKPSNILVTNEGVPKLLDFGISKFLSADFEQVNAATVTKLGAMTPGYASPEQLQHKSVTTATDIYSLGVILYELLSGHRPFEAKENDLQSIYKAVLEDEPPPPSALVNTITKDFKKKTEAKTEVKPTEDSEAATKITNFDADTKISHIRHTAPQAVNLNSSSLRGDLDNIVLKALRKEPERRYSSAENLAEDISRHQQGLPVTARPNTLSYRFEKFIKRNRTSVFAGAMILLAIIGGIGATLWQAQVARAERARAERRFKDVRQLANSFLFEFSPMIENLPGSTPARKLLVTRALEYLDSLSSESSGDAELAPELAAAYEKVGDVQGNPQNPNLGDTKGALESYDKAAGIREKLLAENPQDTAVQLALADLYKRIGGVHFYGDDQRKANDFYDKAIVLYEQVLAREPNDFETRAKFSEFLRAKALLHFVANDNKKALEFYDRARQINEKLYREKSDDPKIAEQHAYIFTAIGEAQSWDDDPENAALNLQKGLDLLIPLAEKHPNNQALQRSLMLAYQKRASVYEDAEVYNKAVELFEKASDAALKKLAADPLSYQAKRDVAMGYKLLAQALDSAGKSAESLEKLELAREKFRELAATDPNNAEAPYDVANTGFSIGETLLSLKKYDAALETFLRARDEFQTVIEKNPGNAYAKRMSSYNLTRIGRTYAALAEKGGGRENLQKALENYRAGLERLYKLRDEGNLGEFDNKEIAELEKEAEKIEVKLRK